MIKQQLLRMSLACLVVAALGSHASVAASSSAPTTGVDETARSEAAVIAVDEHWLEAEVSGDSAWLDAMLLPEYRSIGADGSVHPKAGIVAHAAKNRGFNKERVQVEAWLKAHPSGKSVVIHGEFNSEAHHPMT